MAEKSKLKNCIHCNAEIAKSVTKCPQCGGKNKKPFYKRVWFIVLVVIIVLIAIGGGSGDSSTDSSATNETTSTESNTTTAEVSTEVATEEPVVVEPTEPEIVYTPYSVDELMADLNTNALKANGKYNDQYVEITGRLALIDSSGQYISLFQTDDPYAFLGVQCFIKTDEQKAQVMEMSMDQMVTVRGQITDVGEVMAYTLNIDEIVVQ